MRDRAFELHRHDVSNMTRDGNAAAEARCRRERAPGRIIRSGSSFNQAGRAPPAETAPSARSVAFRHVIWIPLVDAFRNARSRIRSNGRIAPFRSPEDQLQSTAGKDERQRLSVTGGGGRETGSDSNRASLLSGQVIVRRNQTWGPGLDFAGGGTAGPRH